MAVPQTVDESIASMPEAVRPVLAGVRDTVRRAAPAAEERVSGRMPCFVVVSGLPASGKSTLALRLGGELGLPVLDKDAILEALFERSPVVSGEHRSALSREADSLMRQQAGSLQQAILVSWWRHPASTESTGTDVGWLRELGTQVIEVHIDCPPDLAAVRFVRRRRHPGHLDGRWDEHTLRDAFARHARLGPLGLGVCIDAAPDVDAGFAGVFDSLRMALASVKPGD